MAEQFDAPVLPRGRLLPSNTPADIYLLEFSNRGGKQHENPTPVNYRGMEIRCRVDGCHRQTRSLLGFCTEHQAKKNLWPKHTADWIGRLIPPGFTREQCLTDAPALYTIAEILVRWMGEDKERRSRMDAFVSDLLDGRGDRVFIFEVKSIHSENFRHQTRMAIGQLVDYEYFQVKRRTETKAKSVVKCVVYSKKPPQEMMKFLEASGFKVFWTEGESLVGTDESMNALSDLLIESRMRKADLEGD